MVVAHSFHIDQTRLQETGVYADDQYDDVAPPHAGSDYTAKLVGFTLRPHYNAPDFDRVSLRDMEQAAADVDVTLYAIDDQSAIKVVDDRIEVVSEGQWVQFEAGHGQGIPRDGR
jgi:hypothetical protein